MVRLEQDGYTINERHIKKLVVLMDTESGPLKYGEKEYVEEYYNKALKLYNSVGFKDKSETLKLIDFSESDLEREEIVTFMNYMLTVSANAENINKILKMDLEEAKEKLKFLKSVGF